MNSKEEEPSNESKLTVQQSQIFVKMIEIGFDPDLCHSLLILYPEDTTFTEFLNRFLSDENGLFNHQFIASEKENECKVCQAEKGKHLRRPVEEEEKISEKYSKISSEESKFQRSTFLQSQLTRSKIRVQCKICYEFVPDQHLLKLSGVSHDVCIDCLKTHISSEIMNGKLFPLKCPHCVEPILDLKLVKELVGGTTFLKFQRLTLNFCLTMRKDFFYCPGCFRVLLKTDCLTKKYLDFKTNTERQAIICAFSACGARICFDCYREEHYPTLCELIAEKELKDFGLTSDVQKCQKCKTYVEKTKGCNHILCRCGFEFCWLCGGEYSPQHYNRNAEDPLKVCPFKRRPEDYGRIEGRETGDKGREISDPNEKDVTRPGDDYVLTQADFERIKRENRKKRTEKRKKCLMCLPCWLCILFFGPIYFFLVDVTVSDFWVKNVKERACLKGFLIALLLLFAILFWPFLLIYWLVKFCKNFLYAGREREMLFREEIL